MNPDTTEYQIGKS